MYEYNDYSAVVPKFHVYISYQVASEYLAGHRKIALLNIPTLVVPAQYTDIAILTSTALLTEACLQQRNDGMTGDESLVACCMNPTCLLQTATSLRVRRRLIEATSTGSNANKTTQPNKCKHVYNYTCIVFLLF